LSFINFHGWGSTLWGLVTLGDSARGTGVILGIRPPEKFPYQEKSIISNPLAALQESGFSLNFKPQAFAPITALCKVATLALISGVTYALARHTFSGEQANDYLHRPKLSVFDRNLSHQNSKMDTVPSISAIPLSTNSHVRMLNANYPITLDLISHHTKLLLPFLRAFTESCPQNQL